MSSKTIVILGATGSIGRQCLDVVAQHPDRLTVRAIAVHGSLGPAVDQALRFAIPRVVATDEALPLSLREDCEASYADALDASGRPLRGTIAYGYEALLELCHLPEVDLVVNALVGAVGLRASYETLKAGKTLALANKESLVVGGDLLMPMAAPGQLLPIDSEHGAIFQCLIGEDHREMRRLWVTASGGPFRGKTRAELLHVTREEALSHPTWSMGAKITIDSATLMNKGLEVIEAHHLFAVDYDRIEVVVQPQSAIHSMVEFVDGSVKAHLGVTDMRIPIQYALSYPERWSAPVPEMDFRELGTLEFAAPDKTTFRCLDLACHAGRVGGTLPAAMNAANEVAVASFLQGRCSFLAIADVVEEVMERSVTAPVESLEQLEAVDAEARLLARRIVERG